MTDAITYVLPLRWSDDSGLDELTFYLRWLSQHAEVIVVDGSEPGPFSRHARAWSDRVAHVPPDPDLSFLNGKVNGVTTGVRLATHDKVIVADDDVRYDLASLERTTALLDEHDLVRPQNYFSPVVWHAVWDTARTLMNRAFGPDYPGTLAVRKHLFIAAGGYDGDVLFENLELIRTIKAAGGREAAPLDLYVRRLPPGTRHFVGQRVRQAYDEFALPGRLALWLSVVPLIGLALRTRAWRSLMAGALASVAAAEAGRRRGGGQRYFPPAASLCAPGWLLERGSCMWLAVIQRAVRGGVRYRDGVIDRAATPETELERRLG